MIVVLSLSPAPLVCSYPFLDAVTVYSPLGRTAVAIPSSFVVTVILPTVTCASARGSPLFFTVNVASATSLFFDSTLRLSIVNVPDPR